MSQNWQQPQQPGGYPPPQPGGGFPPPPPPAPQQGNAVLALGVGLVVAVVAAGLYAGLLFALADTDKGEVTKLAYAGIGVGAVIGLAIAKLGGRNVGLWVVGAVLALAAVVLGELYGYALMSADYVEKMAEQFGGTTSEVPSANDIFFDEFGDLFKAWKEELEAWEWLFIALAPIASVYTAFKVSNDR